MRLLLQGSLTGPLTLHRKSDGQFNTLFIDDNGAGIDSAEQTWFIDFYDKQDRRGDPVLTLEVAASQYFGTAEWDDTDSEDLIPGATLYAFGRRENGTTTTISSNCIAIRVG